MCTARSAVQQLDQWALLEVVWNGIAESDSCNGQIKDPGCVAIVQMCEPSVERAVMTAATDDLLAHMQNGAFHHQHGRVT